MRTAERQRLRNQIVRSRVKTLVKKARQAVISGDPETAKNALDEAYSELDNASRKGVIHRNNAARRKSRLARLFNKHLSSSQ